MAGPSGTERPPYPKDEVDDALGETDEVYLTWDAADKACCVKFKLAAGAGRGECIGVLQPDSSVACMLGGTDKLLTQASGCKGPGGTPSME